MNGSAREEILGRVRAASASAAVREGLEAWEQTRPAPVRPAIPGDVTAYFLAKAETNLMSIREIGSLADVPSAVAQILARTNLAPDISVAPSLRALPWPVTMEVRDAKARIGEKLTVTRAVAAIAETGSVVLCSGDDAPGSLNYAPEVHVIVLDRADITPYLEDGLAKVKAAYDPWPRAVNVVSGPHALPMSPASSCGPRTGPRACICLSRGPRHEGFRVSRPWAAAGAGRGELDAEIKTPYTAKTNERRLAI